MISDSGKYSGFGYPDILIPVEITNLKHMLLIMMTDIYIQLAETSFDFFASSGYKLTVISSCDHKILVSPMGNHGG